MTEKIKKHVDINAPVEKVFDYMADPKHFLDIWPSMIDIENIQKSEEGVRSYDWTYKMAGLKFRGTSETEEVVENERTVVINKKGIPSTFVWEYRPHNGGTALDVEIEYEMPTPVLGRVAEKAMSKINDREAELLLANLKTVMEL
jgi:carbon monoxide dehydrogenase subunit G